MGDIGSQRASLLDAPNALRRVSAFFPKEWGKTDVSDIHIDPVGGGLINTLQRVQRNTAAITEPATVLIRHFGLSGDIEEPPESSISLSAAQQAMVYWEMSRRGWGPHIYGLFPGGRLEEYIDSHPLTAAESTQANIAREVARSYARLHSLRLPLRRDSFMRVVEELSRGSQSKHAEVMRKLLAVEHPSAKEFAIIFQDTDWTQELNWVSDLFAKHNCKITITHGDTNYLNVLIKNFERETPVVFIDYETVSYSYRGFDIGGHFNERMYCYNQPDSQLTGYTAPSLEDQRLFCEAYLHETQELGETLSEQDTVGHLILEANIG